MVPGVEMLTCQKCKLFQRWDILGSVADKSEELKDLGDYVYKVDINSVDLCWEYCGMGGHELRTLHMSNVI